MKHVFIINPMAGPKDVHLLVEKEVEKLNIDYIIHVTTAPKEATTYVRDYIKNNPDEEVRFYACGGDGTINEVAAGVVGADTSKVSMTNYPIGSGNDYIKIFGGANVFMDLSKLVKAEARPVDVMEVNEGLGYSINVLNFGFDCNVLKIMEKIKRNKNTTKEKAYNTAVLRCVINSRKNEGVVICDGERLNDSHFCLCSIANGQYYGSQYRTAPKSVCDDGLLDICIIKPVSILTLAAVIGKYKAGKHLDDKKLQKILKYRQTSGLIEIKGPEGFCIGLDGELYFGTEFRVKNLKHAIRFAVPNE